MVSRLRPRRALRRLSTITVLGLFVVPGLVGCTAARPVTTTVSTSTATATATASGECNAGVVGPTVPYASLHTGTFTQAAAEAGGRALRVAATTVAFQDFTPAAGTIDGAVVGPQATALIGAGPDRTLFEVAAKTSTHAADIPTTFPDTNQLDVLRIAGSGTVLRGFGIRATDQGHLYNGLRVGRVTGLRASDITVTGIPGDAASPPGETFGINDYRTVGSEWSHVLVDGAGVGASGFATNSSRDVTICDTVSKHNRFGMGFAFWQSSGIRCVDCTAEDNGRAGFNFERVTGTNELVRPVARGNTYGVRISNDLASGTFRIIDPQLTDGHFTVTVPYRYNHAVNQQRLSAITLVIDGKSRPDLLRIQRY